jgi:hypothetical protein
MSKEKQKYETLKECEEKECEKKPSHGYIDTIKKIRCAKHKLNGMIQIGRKMCKNCRVKTPSFNYPTEKIGEYCSLCVKTLKFTTMINVNDKRRLCITCKKVRGGFNLPGIKKNNYCASCRTYDMVDITGKKKCINCKIKYPSFNLPNVSKPEYCNDCANHETMIDVIHKMCSSMLCDGKTRPSWGFPNSPVTHCVTHADLGMIDINNKNKMCINCENVRSSYAKNGNIKSTHCITCVKKLNLENMIDITKKKCIECKTTIPSMNYSDKKHGIYCILCMNKLNITGMINVVSPKCIETNCDGQRRFGELYKNKQHCTKHAGKHEYVKNRPICELCGNDEPWYSDDNYPKRCYKHKYDSDVNIVEQKCNNCFKLRYLRDDKKLCNECFQWIVKNVRKVKEMRVKEFLDNNKIKYKYHDKTADDSCSNRRPDFIIDKDSFIILLEVDENQHGNYRDECEKRKLIGIHNDFGSMPVVVVRYNPDIYRNNLYEKILPNDKNRQQKLLVLLNYLLNIEMWEDGLGLFLYYMFYDGYDNQDKLIKYDYDNQEYSDICYSLD